MLRGYFIFIFMISLFAVPHPLWAQTGQCPAVFQVTKKQEDVVLGHGTVNIPKTHTLILKLKEDIPATADCSDYADVKEIRLHAVEEHDQAFQSLTKGDVVTGTLNYHRPSPYGKFLHDNYHYGLRLLTLKKAKNGEIIDYGGQQYVYFRHIGLY